MSFKLGQSGNPGGRPRKDKALIEHLRAELGAGEELVDFALGVMRGTVCSKHILPNGEEFVAQQAKIRDRVECLKFLAAYMWGKPTERAEVELSGPDKGPIDLRAIPAWTERLSDEQLRGIIGIISGPIGGPAGEIPSGDPARLPEHVADPQSAALVTVQPTPADETSGIVSKGPGGL